MTDRRQPSVFTRLANWWAQPAPMPVADDSARDGPQGPPQHWSWLTDAIRSRLAAELEGGIAQRREIAPDDVYEVTEICVAPPPERRSQFETLLRDFDQAQLRNWVCSNCGDVAVASQGLAFAQSLALQMRAPAEAPPKSDLDRLLDDPTPSAATGVDLGGNFKPLSEVEQTGGDLRALIHIQDATGTRHVRFTGTELVLGRATKPAIDGEFVSARHLRLRWEANAVWVHDTGSANGTFAATGRVTPGRPLRVDDKVELRLGCELANRAQDDAQCPRLIVSPAAPRTVGAGSTPLRAPAPAAAGAAVTPLRTAEPAENALFSLEVSEAPSQPSVVHVHRLPFTIGRASLSDLVVDDRHLAVSRRHCTLVALDDQANTVRVRMEQKPTHGTFLRGEPQPLEFDWPVGESLWLGGTAYDQQFAPISVVVRLPESPPDTDRT